jgi:multisubunit Na+/H+ antiporter MnhE subunit
MRDTRGKFCLSAFFWAVSAALSAFFCAASAALSAFDTLVFGVGLVVVWATPAVITPNRNNRAIVSFFIIFLLSVFNLNFYLKLQLCRKQKLKI